MVVLSFSGVIRCFLSRCGPSPEKCHERPRDFRTKHTSGSDPALRFLVPWHPDSFLDRQGKVLEREQIIPQQVTAKENKSRTDGSSFPVRCGAIRSI